MKFKRARAYAKINLSLEVGEKRTDGYHPLSSLFVKISFYDSIIFWFHSFGKPKIRVYMDREKTDLSNSMMKAAVLYQTRFAPDLSVSIFCRKQIPAGGGLGGGSSDAAAVLKNLNQKYNRASEKQLAEAAAEIGSDVPFFLSGNAAYVSGRGEIIKSIPGRKKTYGILFLPDYFSSTSEAYRLLDESGTAKRLFHDPVKEIDAFYAPLQTWSYGNDFLPVLEKISPVMKKCADSIRQLKPPYWNLSGSGSSLYALFESKQERDHFFYQYNEKNVRKKNFFLV